MLIPLVLVLVGIAFLWGAAGWLVNGAVVLSRHAGVSPIVIGLTVVSLGTSAPEFVVSAAAALRGSADLAVGNVLGSNLANIGLILGIAAIMTPLKIHGQVVFREIPWMLAVTVLFVPLAWNGTMGRVEGAVLAIVLFLYLYFLVQVAGDAPEKASSAVPDVGSMGRGTWAGYLRPILLLIAGVIGLVIGGRSIVIGASQIAVLMGIPEMVIGLSVVAVGTSLPELATSAVAAIRKEADLAVGNIVGSNIFNLTFVFGGTALIGPFAVEPGVLRIEFVAVLLVSLFLVPLTRTKSTLNQREGFVLLTLYAGAWVWILLARGG